MKSGCYTLAFVLSAFLLEIATCRGTTNDLENAILSFPEIRAATYRIDQAVVSANILISAGREAVCAELERVATERKTDIFAYESINEKACHICRLLFTPTNSAAPLRRPRLGSLQFMPQESMEPVNWPTLPFAISRGVPLSMLLGYARAGFSERATNYLNYCKENGTFRTEPFPQPAILTASNALQDVFSSAAWKQLKWKDEGLGWKYELNEDETKSRLWRQIENLARPASQKK